MKFRPRFLFFSLAVLFCMAAKAQTKHALIVAIGKYQSSSWNPLHSNTDAYVIKTALLNRGFEENNIVVVQDDKASYRGIADALKAFINDANMKAGDIAVIHFSSHGQQLQDDSGDEMADGLDESIVSWDAVYDNNTKNYKNVQGNYFRDDEFGVFIRQLRTKLGEKGDILVLIDACHSGSGTKGAAIVRGGKPRLVSETFDPNKWAKEDTAGVFSEASGIKGDQKGLATYVVISAARSEEVDSETDDKAIGPMGSLSNAIMKVFEQLDAGVTYRTLFAKIQSIMNETVPGQHPVLEGDGLDRQLFGGRFISQKPFIEIVSIDGKEIKLKAGILCGLGEGAKIVIDPSGTLDPSKVTQLASGTVTTATNYSATVILDKVLRIQPDQGWAFITEPVYKTESISLQMARSYSEPEISSIREAFKDLPLIRFDGKPELLLVKGPEWDSLKIASNGYLFDTIPNNTPGKLKEKIQHYAQYKLLRGLEIKDSTAYVEVRMVPVIKGKADTAKIDTKLVKGIYEYHVGDTMKFWVRNTGKLPVYFNILDLQPNGVINAILPQKGYITPEELRVDAGVSRLVDYSIAIWPPYGMEVLKIFVSKEKINMEIIADSWGSKGSFKPLENLMKNSYNVASKGEKTVNISSADGSIYNLLFRIVPAKK